MSSEDKQSVFIAIYSGQGTAGTVYEKVRALQKDKAVAIKTAAVVTRKGDGRLKLQYKKHLTVGKGAFAGGMIGLLLAGFGGGAVVGGALIGAAIGSGPAKKRHQLKQFLEDKLGRFESALAIVTSADDWAIISEATAQYGGDILELPLTAEAEAELNALAEDEEAVAAMTAEVDVEETAALES